MHHDQQLVTRRVRGPGAGHARLQQGGQAGVVSRIRRVVHLADRPQDAVADLVADRHHVHRRALLRERADHLLGVGLHGRGELGQVLALPRGRDVLVLRVGPEVGVHDVQVDLHPGRAHAAGQRQVHGQVAVARGRVHPQPHPDVVAPVLLHDRDRALLLAAVGELRPGREFLRGEGQVSTEVQARCRGVGSVSPELPHADVRAGPAVHGELGVPRLGAAGQRDVHRVPRIQRHVAGGGHGLPVTRLGGDLDGRAGRRAAGVERDAEVAEAANLAQVDHQVPGPRPGAPVGAGVAVYRVGCRVPRLRGVGAGLPGQRPVDCGDALRARSAGLRRHRRAGETRHQRQDQQSRGRGERTVPIQPVAP